MYPLRKVAPYAQHVKELQLSTMRYSPSLWQVLAEYLPNLVRLRLMVEEVPLPLIGVLPFKYSVMHKRGHRWLRELDIGFAVTKGRPFPREACWAVLTLIPEMCPALEVVRFGALFPVEGGGIDERNVPLDWLMDLRRTADGKWKERKWGMS